MNERRAQRVRLRSGEPGDIERCRQWVRVEVRYSDLDAQGHANNAVFFTYFEQARVAFLAEMRARGLEQVRQEARDGEHLGLGEMIDAGNTPRIEASDIPYVIASASCVYQRPIASLAPISIGVYCSELSRVSFEVRYVVCDERHETIYATGTTLIVNVDPATGRPRMLPEWMRRALSPASDS